MLSKLVTFDGKEVGLSCQELQILLICALCVYMLLSVIFFKSMEILPPFLVYKHNSFFTRRSAGLSKKLPSNAVDACVDKSSKFRKTCILANTEKWHLRFNVLASHFKQCIVYCSPKNTIRCLNQINFLIFRVEKLG
jgi:hypothetical protein